MVRGRYRYRKRIYRRPGHTRRRRKMADYTLGDLQKWRKRKREGYPGAKYELQRTVQNLRYERQVPALEEVEIRKVEVEKQRARLKINKLMEQIEKLEEREEAAPGQIRKLESELNRLVRERNAIAARLDRLRKEKS